MKKLILAALFILPLITSAQFTGVNGRYYIKNSAKHLELGSIRGDSVLWMPTVIATYGTGSGSVYVNVSDSSIYALIGATWVKQKAAGLGGGIQSDSSLSINNRINDTAAALRAAIGFGGGGGSQTPWTSNINAAGFNLIGGTTTTSTLTFQTTTANATTGSDFIWLGGNNGATELMRLRANNQLVLKSNGVNLNGAGTQNYIAAGTNSYNDYFAGTVHKFYSYAVGSYFVQFANGTSTANYISTPLTVGGTGIATARLHIAAGTATASTAPLKFTSGTNLTTPENGSVEYNGTDFFVTRSAATRETVTVNEAAQTLNNKRINRRITTTASSSTPTPDSDASDQFNVTALAADATFGAPTGTPTDGQVLLIRIKDNGTARTLAWNAIYRAGTDIALPTTTVISKVMYVQFVYNSADTKWDIIGNLGGF